MFHIENSLRWRLCAIDDIGHVTFWNVYESESDARTHARISNRDSKLGRRWYAICVSPGDELSSSFNIHDYLES